MSADIHFPEFAAKKQRLAAELKLARGRLQLQKNTSSNLFRYDTRVTQRQSGVSLAGFNQVVAVNAAQRTLDVEGLATFERIVDGTLAEGLLPLVSPELKHITIGGATVGIGIESNCFRYGFVHDSLIEAEVVLPDGRIVLARSDNEHADLFNALPNSYGTLGYILRATIRLMPALPWVHLNTLRFSDLNLFLDAMHAATKDPSVDFTEGLFYPGGPFYLVNTRFAAQVPRTADIIRDHVFYKLVQQQPEVYLATRDYIFRYDPEWFWNIPETGPYRLFRRCAPLSLRNSGFYKRYFEWQQAALRWIPWSVDDDTEPLIQDWEVPWTQARELVEFALSEVDLGGKPWLATPICTPRTPTLYPIEANLLYLNLGCYCYVKKVPGRPAYWYTRILDEKCFSLGGIKMLYSSTFLAPEEFWRIYNGNAYWDLKKRYDPKGVFKNLYEKCAFRA
ncbi:MAG TPA: FAD-binding oxidoreductase [Burkholderiales bacterium]|nr:FAD-binding oxidoreductase [Burkholderiales bacterium]